MSGLLWVNEERKGESVRRIGSANAPLSRKQEKEVREEGRACF